MRLLELAKSAAHRTHGLNESAVLPVEHIDDANLNSRAIADLGWRARRQVKHHLLQCSWCRNELKQHDEGIAEIEAWIRVS